MPPSDEIIRGCEGCALFEGIEDGDLPALLGCLGARERSFRKGEYVLRADTETRHFGLVACGVVIMQKEDSWGNRSVVGTAAEGDTFAESFACAARPLLVSVVAQTDCTILFLDAGRLLKTCSSACAFHMRLIENLVADVAGKNVALNGKLGHLAQRTTREKVLSYLDAQSRRAGSARFEIPLDRQQLADYLCVNRSALSAELSHMHEEGIIAYRRNRFELLGARPVDQRPARVP
jgi:CRP-like cAMP-binding protein